MTPGMWDHTKESFTEGRLVTKELADWVAGVTYEDLSEDARTETGKALVDYLGETLFVGGTKSLGQEIAKFCALYGGSQPEATIISTGEKVQASRAAMANGTMALGFEFADWGGGARPYPFAVTAALALAEARKLSGQKLALAIAVGYEVMGRVFYAIHPGWPTSHYTPAVYGTVAAAAACAKLLDLDAKKTLSAIGFGCAFASGSFQGHEEGTWQRCLNGGTAGERAVTAALLAEFGYEGTTMGLEGIQGFAKAFATGEIKIDKLLDNLGESWSITERWVKAYPMNTTLHAPAEALMKVMDDHDLVYQDIDRIEAHWQKVEPFLAKQKIKTVVSAQASLPFALAMSAKHRKITVDQFTDETVHDPEIQDLLQRVSVTQDEELYKQVPRGSFPGKVTVFMKNGSSFTDQVLYPRGCPYNRLSEADFKQKFMHMAERVIGMEQAEKLYETAIRLTEVDDISRLATLFSRQRS
jgi:2-methylcitrate dehydratase